MEYSVQNGLTFCTNKIPKCQQARVARGLRLAHCWAKVRFFKSTSSTCAWLVLVLLRIPPPRMCTQMVIGAACVACGAVGTGARLATRPRFTILAVGL